MLEENVCWIIPKVLREVTKITVQMGLNKICTHCKVNIKIFNIKLISICWLPTKIVWRLKKKKKATSVRILLSYSITVQ